MFCLIMDGFDFVWYFINLGSCLRFTILFDRGSCCVGILVFVEYFEVEVVSFFGREL